MTDGEPSSLALTFSASSIASKHNLEQARLSSALDTSTAWGPRSRDDQPWLKADMGESMFVSMIATRGGPGDLAWVTDYNLTFSDDDVTYDYVRKADNEIMVSKIGPARFDGEGCPPLPDRGTYWGWDDFWAQHIAQAFLNTEPTFICLF